MRALIPDTNFLIYLVKYRLLDELEKENFKIITIKQIIDELNKIEKKKTAKVKDKVAASIAKEFLNSKAILEVQEGETDDAIITLAKRFKATVGTMDKELTKKAKKEKIKIIKIRQKKYLIEE
ncbi:MAG: hypothetical protein QXK80_01245 [Candidatus Pacearchaeota archaeon]